MEWVTRCVLLINLILIDERLSAVTPVTVEKDNLGQGICMIRYTTIVSTVKRPGDCKQMYLEYVNLTNPSQEVFDSIANGLDLLRVFYSRVRSVFLPPNLIGLEIFEIKGGQTQLIIDRKFNYKLQGLELENVPRLPVNLTSLQSLKMVKFLGMREAKIDLTIFRKMMQLEKIFIYGCENMIISNSLQMQSLRTLEISDCPIKTLGKAALKLPSLDWLELNNNSLQSISEYVNTSTKLTYITVHKNQLGRVSLDEFAHLKQLQILALEDCEITELSTKSVVHLPALVFLHLNRNKLTHLDVKLWNVPMLHSLTLRYNRLKQITGVAQLLTVKDLTLLIDDNPWDCQWVKAMRKRYPKAKVLAPKSCTQ